MVVFVGRGNKENRAEIGGIIPYIYGLIHIGLNPVLEGILYSGVENKLLQCETGEKSEKLYN